MFKQRIKKVNTFVNTKLSIYNKHKDTIQKYLETIAKHDEIRAHMAKLEDQRQEIEKFKIPNENNLEKHIQNVYQLNSIQAEIDSNTKKIATIQSKKEIIDYYYDIVDILHEYIFVEEKLAVSNSEDTLIRETEHKNELIFEFFRRIDPAYIIKYHYKEKIHLCECGAEFILNDGIYICSRCKNAMESVIDNSKTSYKETKSNRDSSASPYRKLGHLNEWLNRLEAKKIPKMQQDVYNAIINHILNSSRNRDMDLNKLTPKKLKAVLKKLGYNEYYEDISFILSQITGLVPPTLSQNENEILRIMFREVEVAWRKVKPHDRNNFINYPYVLRKLLELLGYDEYLDYFTLSESNDKLMAMDSLWNATCKILKYQFIPSRRKVDEVRY
jgi:hypothetical protein